MTPGTSERRTASRGAGPLLRALPFLVVAAAGLAGCAPSPPAGLAPAAGVAAGLDAMIEASLARAAVQYAALDEVVPDTLFPRTLHPDGTVRTNRSDWWTSGFFPGSLWYLYESTGDGSLRERALRRTWAVEREALNASDHDIGFKILNSFGHAWRLTGDSVFLPVILTAARTLTTRFDPTVGAIRSWGPHPDTTRPFLVIIDNMMNLELLFWAARQTGDRSFYDIAVSHADRSLADHFRPDGSSYHVVEYHPVTGAVTRRRTEQGHADETAWARGQAWGLYGYVVAYRETGYERYLAQAKRIAHFMLTHPNLPADRVPYWDFDAPGIPDALRDASAAAIAAAALLELGDYVEDDLRSSYRRNAEAMLRTLSGPPYRSRPGENGNFLLRHGVGHIPQRSEVDVPLSYADYYYLEGLVRLRRWIRAPAGSARVIPLGDGWARSSVNAVIFRQHGLVSHGGSQYAAWYDESGQVVLARRAAGDVVWETRGTGLTGNVRDAHNAISVGVDGDGVLHVSWDQHGGDLRYARGVAPGSLELSSPVAMTGRNEDRVTYPQFYPLPGGDLLFVYRQGGSGDGDVLLNRYDRATRAWRPLHHPLIHGEGQRNAYVNQLAVDAGGGVHLSWTWRETWDASTNHDILYAYSPDGGATWRRSTSEPYDLPITAATAEIAVAIPQRSDLINQTTLTVDAAGRPLIATYWRPPGAAVPQFHLVWHDGEAWRTAPIGHRTTPFTLAGGGTRRIPVSRPLVLAAPDGAVYMVFRDLERGGGISMAVSRDPERRDWEIRELYAASVGQWEPVHDPVAWSRDGQLHLLVQRVGQGQAETLEDLPPQPIRVLEWHDFDFDFDFQVEAREVEVEVEVVLDGAAIPHPQSPLLPTLLRRSP
jgi:hypothetical protein